LFDPAGRRRQSVSEPLLHSTHCRTLPVGLRCNLTMALRELRWSVGGIRQAGNDVRALAVSAMMLEPTTRFSYVR